MHNADFGLLADLPAAYLGNKGVLYVTTDTEQTFISDGDEWFELGGGGGGGAVSQRLDYIATAGTYLNGTDLAINGLSSIYGGSHQLSIPSQATAMNWSVSVISSVLTASSDQAFRLALQLEVQDTLAFPETANLSRTIIYSPTNESDPGAWSTQAFTTLPYSVHVPASTAHVVTVAENAGAFFDDSVLPVADPPDVNVGLFVARIQAVGVPA